MVNQYQVNGSSDKFLTGLVFGFDVGTGSIGYAVRKGSEFKYVGVLICPEDTSDLSSRRTLRRQRRTLRSRKYRRNWFAQELEKLGLPKPTQPMDDPISLRVQALKGHELKAEELYAALTHLFKRRGYSKVPWANREARSEEGARKKEEGVILEKIKDLREQLAGLLPSQYLSKRRMEVGNSPTEKWGRKIYWPRELLEQEFRAIVEAQSEAFPKLAERIDWLLFGNSRTVKNHPVLFSGKTARNPGVLGMRWPRFDNRSPALDSFQPVDEQGRPLHVVRKNKEAFTQAQWELALMNFRVLHANTRQKLDPRIHFPAFVESLRNQWNKKKKVTAARLLKLAEPFKSEFLLIEGQKPLTPETGSGRARYSSLTLERIRQEIAAGKRVDPPQPILRRKGESVEQALNRYLAEIKHPLVRHRLVLFRRVLVQLVKCYGTPDVIVLEAVRSLALGKSAKNELNKRNEEFRRQRLNARDDLAVNNESTTRNAIQRYRLWQEAKGRCPFCLQMIERTELGHGADIEHLVPRSIVDCNEFYNLTVAHIRCNRELKGDSTPFRAFGETERWADLKDNAQKTFTGRKLEIFLSPSAEELIEQKADLQHTAYIARVIRHVTLVQLGWLGENGHDPTPEKQNPSLRFQVTNGQLTSRLRKAWGLNRILHPLPNGTRWEDLSDADQQRFSEKNRGDLRHHALDAMVIACTLPWLAHRTHGAKDQFGRHGWWTQDEKQRSKAANPVFPKEGRMREVTQQEIESVEVRHHVSRSNHQQAYATTLYAKKAKNTYVAREVFTTLTPKNLASIWPESFASYCESAWSRYSEESRDIADELKKTKGNIPVSFTSKLCFAHFQKWRAEKAPDFSWPTKVKIPIRNVRLISVKDDTAVAPFSLGTHAYVKRTGFKEVRVYLAQDQKSFVPVFIPYYKYDSPVFREPYVETLKPVVVIRRGMVVETKRPFATGQLPGKYRVVTTAQVQLKLLPHHVANKEEAILAFGLGKKGLQPMWADFIRALGYELPHSAPAKSQSASPVQT